MTYGFTQLAAELIAFDQWDRSPSPDQQPILTGIVTTGQIWQLGYCYRQKKQIVQDLKLYQVPDNIETIAQIVVRALLDESNQASC